VVFSLARGLPGDLYGSVAVILLLGLGSIAAGLHALALREVSEPVVTDEVRGVAD